MKISAAFKPGELLGIFGFFLVTTALIIGFASTLLFQVAFILWVPFLVLLLWVVGKNTHKTLPALMKVKSSEFFLMVKMIGVFLLIIAGYFSFGQGLLLYQSASFDKAGAPVLIQFANMAQLIWAVKLALITWIIASSLALAMGATHKDKMSQFLTPLVTRQPRYALVIDSVIGFAVISLLLFFLSVGTIELSRSVVAYLGFERPIFPELTVIILTLVLVSGYFVLRLKKNAARWVEKSASIGWILVMQTVLITVLLLLGQGIIIFFPREMIEPLMQPIMNIFTWVSYETTWLYVTLAAAITSAPLLARYLARSFSNLSIAQAFLILVLPLVLGFVVIFKFGFSWMPMAYVVPISLDNIIYQIGPAQVILISVLILFLLCWARSNSLQMALVDIMPTHMGQRLRRLRGSIAQQTFPLILVCSIYLFLGNYSFYFFSSILLVLLTLILLWVSLHLFYNLTHWKR